MTSQTAITVRLQERKQRINSPERFLAETGETRVLLMDISLIKKMVMNRMIYDLQHQSYCIEKKVKKDKKFERVFVNVIGNKYGVNIQGDWKVIPAITEFKTPNYGENFIKERLMSSIIPDGIKKQYTNEDMGARVIPICEGVHQFGELRKGNKGLFLEEIRQSLAVNCAPFMPEWKQEALNHHHHFAKKQLQNKIEMVKRIFPMKNNKCLLLIMEFAYGSAGVGDVMIIKTKKRKLNIVKKIEA